MRRTGLKWIKSDSSCVYKGVVREGNYTLKYLQYQPIILVEHRVLCGLTTTLWLDKISVASGLVTEAVMKIESCS